ncbi:MAG: secretion system protein E [Desulfovibrionaceae bacterium]|nr:secretion system protein E [Desulfovibrionaceae bacterium]
MPHNSSKKTAKNQNDPLQVGLKLAEILIDGGYLTKEHLKYGQRVLAKLTTNKTLLEVLIDLKSLTPDAIEKGLHGKAVKAPVGELLVELGYIRRRELELALTIQKEKKGKKGKKIGEILIEKNFISEEKLLTMLAHQYGVAYVDPEDSEIDKKLFSRVSTKEIQKLNFVPIYEEDDGVCVAFGASNYNDEQISLASKILGQQIIPALTSDKIVQDIIRKYDTQKKVIKEHRESDTVEAVNSLLLNASKEGASDIHIEPLKRCLRVRYRIDGVLVPFKEYPLDIMAPLISRIKIMAGADISEKRRHQDGRILFETEDGTLDIRVSIYTTLHGEKIVLRLLNKQGILLDMKDIGMFPTMLQSFREDALDAASGVVLITGPTGSGKTTTLYSALAYLDKPDISIITAEDPVEYVIDGIAQCSLNPKINITYEETLRHIVRQDPDVIVIGEIRDVFSAEAAIQAALTGHKVLTTFHTEDSIGGLIRLLNMNIEAFMISSTVVSVLAQRLLRRVCKYCAEEHVLEPHEIQRLGYKPAEFQGVTFQRGKGCNQCRYTGYKGRVAIFELLVLNELVKDALLSRKSSYEIRRISCESAGLVTLLEDGIIKASQGATTFEEIMRQLPRLDSPRPFSELQRIAGDIK